MRTVAYEVDAAMRPPQAQVSQAKLFVQSLTGLIPRSLLRFTKMPSEARSRLIPRSLLRGSLFP